MATRALTQRDERGMSLIELMISLVVLAVGLLAVGRMFPAGARAQVQDRLLTGANYFAQEKLESLTGRTWADPLLTDGRHPAGTPVETLEGRQGTRFYQGTTPTRKLGHREQVDVRVNCAGGGEARRSVTAPSYVRR